MFSESAETIAGTIWLKPVREDSPGSTGQGAGSLPVKVTLRKVQQKRKPPSSSDEGKD